MLQVLLCSSDFQAPKKAKRRQQQGEGGGSSNVFSMFEQSQIQEYKEVSSHGGPRVPGASGQKV